MAAPQRAVTTAPLADSEGPPPSDPADVFLDLEDLKARYRCGRNKVLERLADPTFPATTVPGLVRIPLVALRIHELDISLRRPGPDPTDPTPPTPPARPAPPSPRRPGRPRKDRHDDR